MARHHLSSLSPGALAHLTPGDIGGSSSQLSSITATEHLTLGQSGIHRLHSSHSPGSHGLPNISSSTPNQHLTSSPGASASIESSLFQSQVYILKNVYRLIYIYCSVMITIYALTYTVFVISYHIHAGDRSLSSAKEGAAPGSISVSVLSYCSSP